MLCHTGGSDASDAAHCAKRQETYRISHWKLAYMLIARQNPDVLVDIIQNSSMLSAPLLNLCNEAVVYSTLCVNESVLRGNLENYEYLYITK